MKIAQQLQRLNNFTGIACAALDGKTLLAIAAQSLQAGAVSATSWGLRSALISVSGHLGGIAGVAALHSYRSFLPPAVRGPEPSEDDDVVQAAHAAGVCVGKTCGVIFGGMFLGIAQTVGQRAWTELRARCGHGLDQDVIAAENPRMAQMIIGSAFCTNGLLRARGEPLAALCVPGMPEIVRTMVLDVIISGATSCFAQAWISGDDACAKGPGEIKLCPVQRQPAVDASKVRLGFRTAMVGLPFDVLPSAVRAGAHAAGLEAKLSHELANCGDAVCGVIGTVFRLNTWFHYREPEAKAGTFAPNPASVLSIQD